TANATNEMTRRTHELSGEAERTGTQSGAVLENINALKAAVMELKTSVIRVVRTSTAEVDRRAGERYQVDLRGRIAVSGLGTHEVHVVDLSSGGAQVEDAPPLAANSTGTLALAGVTKPIAFVLRDMDSRGVAHLAFTQPATEALRPV